ncbi:MAG: D-alanine--D-alanine ligase [Deltaproteobacteria bacterium]|nr:D-alanine--D-alanine ligase [Deltaproteobacteria bacterium]
MLVGMTYDLRSEYLAKGFSEEEVAEFDSPRTVEGIEQALINAGHQVDRIGSLPALVNRLARGDRWDLVFNIAEGLGRYSREAQVPAVLEYYGVSYTFADPMTLCLTLHKGMAKRVVRDLGLATPDFAVVNETSQATGVRLPYPLFVKPVAEGTGRGIGSASKVNTPEELATACAELISLYRQPVLVETFLPGREFTVGMVGTGAKARVIGVMEVTLRSGADPDAYTLRNKEECDDLVRYRRVKGSLAGQAGELALAAWRGLECRDAGRVDLRCDAQGKPSFLEVNPLAGLHPEHSDLPILCSLVDYPYQKLIERIVASAWERAQTEARSVRAVAVGG